MEAAMEEQPLGEAPPVHCPLVQELPTHVKRSGHVARQVDEQEGRTKHHLSGYLSYEEKVGLTLSRATEQYCAAGAILKPLC